MQVYDLFGWLLKIMNFYVHKDIIFYAWKTTILQERQVAYKMLYIIKIGVIYDIYILFYNNSIKV